MPSQRGGILDYLDSLATSPLLAEEDEDAFQRDVRAAPGWNQWYRQFQDRHGGPPNIRPGGDYNYRAAWLLGATPEYDPGTGEYHGLSSVEVPPFVQPYELKRAAHPTLWKEKFMQQFGANPDVASRDGTLTPEMRLFMQNAARRAIRQNVLRPTRGILD